MSPLLYQDASAKKKGGEKAQSSQSAVLVAKPPSHLSLWPFVNLLELLLSFFRLETFDPLPRVALGWLQAQKLQPHRLIIVPNYLAAPQCEIPSGTLVFRPLTMIRHWHSLAMATYGT